MRDFMGFDLNHHEAAQQTVVKNQIREEFIIFNQQPFLPGDKRKAIAHFEQELLQMRNESGFKVFFIVRRLSFQSQKFKTHGVHGVFDDLCRFFGNTLFPGNGKHGFLVIAQ
jgi:hypothetical protein